jgi:alkylhydroperoxidase family enzyme
VLEIVEFYIVSPESVTDAMFDELKKHFSEAEIVEMLFMTGYYNLLHRFNTAIDLDPTETVVVHDLDLMLAHPS